MNLKKLAASVAAITLVTAPAMAQAVQSTAPVAQRIGASTDNAEKLEGSTGIIVGVLAAAAVIAGIIIIADDDDDAPTSP